MAFELPKDVQTRMAKEFEFALQKMHDASDPGIKLYFFSALYGETGRVLNIAWNKELALLHLALLASYQSANNRLQAVRAGAERGVELPNDYFQILETTCSDLLYLVSRTYTVEKFLSVLSRLAELTYLTTGNGYYLYTKGIIKLAAE